MVVLVLLLASGCGHLLKKKQTKWHPVKQKKHVFIHVVEYKNESYEMISKWYTGKHKNAEFIISSNPTLNPDKPQIGDNVFVPGKLLRTRKKLPLRFVDSFFKKTEKKVKKKKVKVPARESSKKNDDFQLIGPR